MVRYSSPSLFTQEGVDKLTREFLPLRRRAPGFVAYYLIRLSDHEAIGMSLWSSEEALRGGQQDTADWVRENVMPHVSHTPESLVGEVVAWTGPA
jgi:hypothetical protein